MTRYGCSPAACGAVRPQHRATLRSRRDNALLRACENCFPSDRVSRVSRVSARFAILPRYCRWLNSTSSTTRPALSVSVLTNRKIDPIGVLRPGTFRRSHTLPSGSPNFPDTPKASAIVPGKTNVIGFALPQRWRNGASDRCQCEAASIPCVAGRQSDGCHAVARRQLSCASAI